MHEGLEAARVTTQALLIELDVRAHLLQFLYVAKAVLIYGLVDDRHACGLRHHEHPGLLPVGHEAWMYVCLDRKWLQLVLVEEANTLVRNVEICACTAN